MADSRGANDHSPTIHTFDVYLVGVAELTRELEDRLFESGCDDALLSMKDGRVYLSFIARPSREKTPLGAPLRTLPGQGMPTRRSGFRNLARLNRAA